MSLRHALIGLLRERPASGYDLVQIFKQSLNHTWSATQSQIYTELTKLADAGLIKVTAEGPRGRKEYAPTEAGLAELHRYLLETTPEAHPRSEPLLRVFLLGALTRQQAKDYFVWWKERASEDIARWEAVDAAHDWDTDDLMLYSRLALEFGKRLSEMSREWAIWAEAQVPADEPAT